MCRLVVLNVLFILFNIRLSSGIIYNLNASEHKRLPPVFYLEPYDKCMEYPDMVYCLTELVPVSDTPNELLDTIHEYATHTTKHFNNSLNRYGICLNSCQLARNTIVELRYTLEACLNETYWRKYGLKTNLQEYIRCNKDQKEINLEINDIIFFLVLVLILVMNIIGSFCDVYETSPAENRFGRRLLTVFSIRRNLRKLMAPAANGLEPRLKNVKGIAGARVITTFLVIITHSFISAMFYVDNPHYVEGYYRNPATQLFVNGPIIVQAFFIISGFLIVFSLILYSENHRVGWSMLPKGIFLRWIRLTPPYALLMFFMVTWMRFVGSGPFWDIAVTDEVNDCKKYWWQNLIFINNFNDKSQCFLHTWYLAADTQLYCLGLVVFIACKSPTSRKVAITLMLLTGIVIPSVLTYLEDLDGIVIFSPETLNHFFANNLTYNHLYKHALPNIFPFAIGMAVGYLVYYLQKINFDIQKYKKFRYLFLCAFPMGFGVVWSGCIFYWDGPRRSMLVRLAYAAFMKPAYSCLISIGLVGLVFKYERMINVVLEFRIWAVLARLSYSSYLLHIMLLRIMLGMRTTAIHVTTLFLIQQGIFLVFLSFSAALPYWLLVEQPLGQLMKVFVSPEKDKKSSHH